MPKEVVSLEGKLGYSATVFCGGHSRTLRYIGSLGSAWVQPDTGHSGPCRSDVVEAYRRGLDDLRRKCSVFFESGGKERLSLSLANPKSDFFLLFLNDKKIDGVFDSGDKTGEYVGIRENYEEDRRFFVESCYGEWLEKRLVVLEKLKVSEKSRSSHFLLHAVPSLAAAAALGLLGYFALDKTRQEFYSELNNARNEFRQCVAPGNVFDSFKVYSESKEGQESLDLVYQRLKERLSREEAEELDRLWNRFEPRLRDILSESNDLSRSLELAFKDETVKQNIKDVIKSVLLELMTEEGFK